MSTYTLTPTQALRRLQATFNGGRRLGENKVIELVDVITAKGTTVQKVEAFKALPVGVGYQTARMITLRNLWQLGQRFLDDKYIRRELGHLRLLNQEYRQMARQFGVPAVNAFFAKAAQEQVARVGNTMAMGERIPKQA